MTARLNSDGEYEVSVVWDYCCATTDDHWVRPVHYWVSFNAKKKPKVCKECLSDVKVQPVKRRFDELLFGSYRCSDNHEWTRLGFHEERHCIVRKCRSKVTGQMRPVSIDDVVPSNEPLYGHFKCEHCYHTWTSAYSYRGYGQKCMKCGVDTLYHRPRLISYHKYGSGRDKEHRQEFCEKCEEMGQNCKKHFEHLWDRQKVDLLDGLSVTFLDSLLKITSDWLKPDQELPQEVSASLTHDIPLLPPLQDATASDSVLPSSMSPPTDSDSRPHELSITEPISLQQDTIMPSPNEDSVDTNA